MNAPRPRSSSAVWRDQLDHPHICGIHDVGSVDGTHYLVMPLVESAISWVATPASPVEVIVIWPALLTRPAVRTP